MMKQILLFILLGITSIISASSTSGSSTSGSSTPREDCHSCYFEICNQVIELPFDNDFITNCTDINDIYLNIFNEFFGTSERCHDEYEEYLCTVYFEPIREYYNDVCDNYDTLIDHDYNALGATLETRFCDSYENYKILNNTDCVPDTWNNIPFYGGNSFDDLHTVLCNSTNSTPTPTPELLLEEKETGFERFNRWFREIIV